MATPLKISKRSSRKLTLVFVLVGLLLLGGIAAYYFLSQRPATSNVDVSGVKPRNTVDYSPAKPEDKIGESSKDQIAKNEDQPAETNPAVLTVNISNLSQESDQIHVRAFTPSQITGTCVVTFTHGAKQVTKTAPLSVQASYAICQGFDLPKSELGETGAWKVKVEMTSQDGKSGSSEMDLEVT